jgi:hypothetical protein
MTSRKLFLSTLVLISLLSGLQAFSFIAPEGKRIENFDLRTGAAEAAPSPAQTNALNYLRSLVPAVRVEFDPVVASPKFISAREGFLSGANGAGRAVSASAASAFAGDPYGPTKAFVSEHRDLFGFGPESLADSEISREFQTEHNGLHTVVWQQHLDGIPLFEAVFISHTTKAGELVNVCSQFISDPASAAQRGTPNRAAQEANPPVPAVQAVALATQSAGDQTEAAGLALVQLPNEGVPELDQRQEFTGADLKGRAEARVVWLPMSRDVLRLCWQVIFTSRSRGEMFLVLVDAQTGEPLLRHSLTAYLTPASYNVYTGDSPSPFSPGPPTPTTNQPALVPRTLVTITALDTNASPAGWLDDGGNETRGNNVDAHTDLNADDIPDLPRPQGSPFRVFDFPMNLSAQDPTNYSSAAVVQLFYLCNWMHDKLYQLGFTEAAGNFQSNNFGRGGLGNDAVAADAQDGSGTDNANFSTPPDGAPGRMQMFLFGGPSPRRDGDLDAQVVLHEYTHGLSNRRVGGGVGISQLQSEGMGEGWSDFYALSLLSKPGDDVNGNYAEGAYVTYHLGGSTDEQNYYFGIRRYPYTTDLSKNPLTFKDIDPSQAANCSSAAPFHTNMFGSCSAGSADEVHNQGEVWCVTLWEARARFINKYGWTNGNQLMLQLVTDGMNLSPANPTFLQARDAIIQADQVDTGGANTGDLWAAFAKRGMGFSATSPASSTTAGVHEAFDTPDDLRITPSAGFVSRGPVGGPFTPLFQVDSLTNAGTNVIPWTLSNTSMWINFSATSGSLNPGAAASVTGAIATAAAAVLPMGVYPATALFSNGTSSAVLPRQLTLRVGLPDSFTETFDASPIDLAFQMFTFTPDGSYNFYSACHQNITSFPTDPTGGTAVSPGDDGFSQVVLSGGSTVAIYGTRLGVFYIGSNGYITMNSGDSAYTPSLTAHFNRPRVSALFRDLDPSTGGTISWKQLADRVAVTFQGVPIYAAPSRVNSFQIELFFDGRIRISYLAIGALDGLAGLSAGTGVPANFEQSDLTSYAPCDPLSVILPASANENAGVLPSAGAVLLVSPLPTNLVVSLTSSVPARLTVPSTSTILAGQVSNAFDLTLIDNSVADGNQTVTITASAPGFTNAFAAMLVIDDELAPVITQQPVGQIVTSGSFAIFNVSATSTNPLTYQWKLNGTNVPGATSSTYVVNPALPASGGDYTVGVSNAAGGVLSSRARLTVLVGSSPADFILGGNYVSLPVATNGRFLSITFPEGGRYNPAGTGGTNGIDYWLPGNPIYEHCLGVNSNVALNGRFSTLTVTNLSVTGFLHAAVQGTLPGPVLFNRDVSFGVNDKAVKIVDTIQNAGSLAVSNVASLDTTDPDQGRDGTPTASYRTMNDVVSILSPNDAVVAMATNNFLTLVLGSESGFQIPSSIGVDNTNVYGFLTIVDPNGAVADIAINLAQNYGTLSSGQSRTSIWYMVFGSSINEATNLYATVARPALPAPIIDAFAVPPNRFVTRFLTFTGHTYYLESRTSLLSGAWSPLRTNTGDGTTAYLTNIVTGTPLQFFRVRVQ